MLFELGILKLKTLGRRENLGFLLETMTRLCLQNLRSCSHETRPRRQDSMVIGLWDASVDDLDSVERGVFAGESTFAGEQIFHESVIYVLLLVS